jgi:hypothetical protein
VPIVDSGAIRPQRGAYAAVRAAIQDDLGIYRQSRVQCPPVLEEWLAAMSEGREVAVPAHYLPKSARPPLEAGRPMPTAVVSADDRVTFRAETGAELLARLGL